MADTCMLRTDPAVASVAASATRYISPGEGLLGAPNATETSRQVPFRTAGTLSKLYVRVTTNNRGTSTVRCRVAGADATMVASITASTSGEFEDTSNTDAVTAGQLVTISLVTGAGGTTFIATIYSMVFTATSGTMKRHSGEGNINFSTASATRYIGFSKPGSSATEAVQQYRWNAAATLKSLIVYVVTNARTTATVFGTRINGVNGAQSVSVGSTATGLFEDSSNTDAVAVNDLVNLYLTSGSGTGTINYLMAGIEVTSADGTWHFTSDDSTGTSVGFGVTVYQTIGGSAGMGASEANTEAKLRLTAILSNLAVNVETNTVNGNTTVTLRTGGAGSALAVVIGSSATGWFEDTTNTVTPLTSTEMSLQTVTLGSSGTIVFDGKTILVTPIGHPAQRRVGLAGRPGVYSRPVEIGRSGVKVF